jgi:amino acid transporter
VTPENEGLEFQEVYVVLPPVVLVSLGINSLAFAISLTDIIYGQYVWLFRGVALLSLSLGLVWYFYKKEHICTLDEAKKRRKLIPIFTLTSIIIMVVAYLILTYVVVEIIGIALGLW